MKKTQEEPINDIENYENQIWVLWEICLVFQKNIHVYIWIDYCNWFLIRWKLEVGFKFGSHI
jgi:hypothetical protein